MVHPQLKDVLTHYKCEGHSKESISAFVGVECCEEGTGLIEMEIPIAILCI